MNNIWTAVAGWFQHDIRYIGEARQGRSTPTAVRKDVLLAFAQADDIDFVSWTSRFQDNVREGKPGARADERDPRDNAGQPFFRTAFMIR